MVIDTHTHIWLDRAEEDRRELLECLDAVPLRRLYVSGLRGHFPDEETVRRINDEVAGLMRADERIRGQAFLNPLHGARALDELARCRDLGFAMVKLLQATRADDPRNEPVYEQCIAWDMPILQHCFVPQPGIVKETESTPEAVAATARRFPELTIQMAHMGGDFICGIEAVVDCPNVLVDPSGSYGEHGMVDYAVTRLGADRVVFGSDMPGSDIYHNLGKVLGADLTPEQRELVLWKNAERLLP